MKKPRRVLSDNSVCKPSGLFSMLIFFIIFFLNGKEKSSYISIILVILSTLHFILWQVILSFFVENSIYRFFIIINPILHIVKNLIGNAVFEFTRGIVNFIRRNIHKR